MSAIQLTPEQKVRQRFAWFQEKKQLGNVKLTCHRLGISRKTFYPTRLFPLLLARGVEAEVQRPWRRLY